MDLDQIIKDAQAGMVGVAAPMPIQMVFPSSRIDILGDPAHPEVVNLSITSGNGTIQVIIPLSMAAASGDLRPAPVTLAMALLEAAGGQWKAVYAANGDPAA